MGRTFTKMRRGGLQRVRRGMPSAAPVAPPRRHPPASLPPTARVLACGPQRAGRAGQRSGGIAARVALWAALASAGDHLLAVNASPARLGRRRGNRGRRIKERVCLHPGHRGGGGLRAPGPLGAPGRAAGRRGPVATTAGSAARRCPSGLQRPGRCLHSGRRPESRGGAESKGPCEPTQGRPATSASTWS